MIIVLKFKILVMVMGKVNSCVKWNIYVLLKGYVDCRGNMICFFYILAGKVLFFLFVVVFVILLKIFVNLIWF